MPRTLPTIRGGTLHFHQSLDQPIAVGSAAWHTWLTADITRSFRFEHPHGHFTARREQINGGTYWYAYRKTAGKLRKRYLGKAEHVTLGALEAAARALGPAPLDAQSSIVHFVSTMATGDRSTVLATKLIPPPLRARRVRRQRLIDQVQAAMDHALTLIVAPAGSGKTTLVSEWAHTIQQPVAWLALDHDDNDPQRFWSYVLHALHAIVPMNEPVALRAHSMQPDAVVAALTHALARTQAEIVLVLDDFHVLTEPSIHAAITLLLTHVVPQLHLVLASRTDPPLPLARLRARGLLHEMRAADVRFTADEATTFLNDMLAAHISQEHVQQVVARAEGWITGLHLAALALNNHRDPAVVPNFNGNHRYVLDYLADEVLLHQPAWVQTFLLRTAIVERLSAPLCAALLHDWMLPDQDGPRPPTIDAMLQWIERANLFFVPLDVERRWYRYHALFADVLRTRLHEWAPEIVPDLHRRASAWYEQYGFTAEAIEHGISARDWERVVRLIMDLAQPLILRGEVTALLRWLGMLPVAVVHGNVRLNLLHAWALVVSNHVHDLDARLHKLQTMLGPDAETALLGEVMALHSAHAAIRGDFVQAVALAQPALEQLPPTNMYRSTLALIVGAAHEWRGDLATALKSYTEAAEASRVVGNAIVDAAASCSVAGVYLTQGKLSAAAAEYQAVLRRALDAEGKPLPTAALARLGLGELFYVWNDLTAARAAVEDGLALSATWADPDVLALGHSMLARMSLVDGATTEAEALLDTAAQSLARAEMSWLGTVLQAERVHLWLHIGAVSAAVQWAQQFEREIASTLDALRGPEYLALVRVHAAQGKLLAAQAWIDRLLPRAEAEGRWGMVVELLVHQAHVADASGNTRAALQALHRAVALAAPERPIRVFVDAGSSIALLLHKLRALLRRRKDKTPFASEYLDTLIAACHPLAGTAPVDVSFTPTRVLIEPLSTREHEVLHLVAAGLGNRAIADKLVIAPATVKRHLLNIYRKLDATTRVAALQRARALQLIA